MGRRLDDLPIVREQSLKVSQDEAVATTGPKCHGPLPIVTHGEKELTFEPHSTQDLEALGDAGLLWDARCPPRCDSPECASI